MRPTVPASTRLLALAGLPALAALTGCSTPPAASRPAEAAPQATACPASLASVARCLAGRDSAGAYYLIAMPQAWDGTLVLHAHGGPNLGPPSPERAEEDLLRWAIMVKAGHAWAGSTFRKGGVAVRAAAEDTERLRGIFRQHVAVPKRTILHGQSWGASVAAKAAETYTAQSNPWTPGAAPYDAVLLTSGVLAGGTRSYDFRLDLRAIYQYLCHNHPRPDEPAYALGLGLPAGAKMTSAELSARTAECLGLDKPAAQRSPEQQRKVKTLADVVRIPESSIQGHLNWATFLFQDISSKRTGGASPFGNIGAQYKGSPDDAALNAGVTREAADPQAVARLAEDTDLSGRIPVPVLTVKGIHDPTAFVELDSRFKEVMTAGGSAGHLVQTFADFNTHSYLSDPTYVTLVTALLKWVDDGRMPTAAGIAQQCPAQEARHGSGCRFRPDYVPAALETRVPARTRP